MASEESRGKDWEGGKVGVTLSLSKTTTRLASLAKFFVSPSPIFLFHFFPHCGAWFQAIGKRARMYKTNIICNYLLIFLKLCSRFILTRDQKPYAICSQLHCD